MSVLGHSRDRGHGEVRGVNEQKTKVPPPDLAPIALPVCSREHSILFTLRLKL
jgi:hypothetical protein